MTGRTVFIRDLTLMAAIGVHPHEHAARQRVRVNVELSVDDDPAQDGIDRLSRTVDYAQVADAVRVLYGGSVKSSNVVELMGKADVDGALVGGASLKADEFAKIVGFQSL